MSPVAAGVDDDEFVAASSLAEFCGVGAGRDADRFFVDQGSALGLGGGEPGEKTTGPNTEETRRSFISRLLAEEALLAKCLIGPKSKFSDGYPS